MLPEGVPRIFTANAESAQAWCGNRLKWSEPLQRKTIVFSITQPLCDDSWRRPEGGAVVEDDGDDAEVARLMAGLVGAYVVETTYAKFDRSRLGKQFQGFSLWLPA